MGIGHRPRPQNNEISERFTRESHKYMVNPDKCLFFNIVIARVTCSKHKGCVQIMDHTWGDKITGLCVSCGYRVFSLVSAFLQTVLVCSNSNEQPCTKHRPEYLD